MCLSIVGPPVSCAIQATVLTLVAGIVLGSSSFRNMFCLSSHAAVFGVMQATLAAVILSMRSSAPIAAADLAVPMGLDMVWQHTGPVLHTLLATASPCKIWSVCFLYMGIRRMHGCSGSRAMVIQVAVVAIEAGATASTAALGQGLARS